MKYFIDVDNTILEHSGFYSIETEGRIHSSIGKFPSENENAIKIMYDSAICRDPDLLKKFIHLDNVYFLTKFPAIEYEIHKQKRVAEILDLTHEELINLKDSNGINKYIYLDLHESKVQTVKDLFHIDSLEDYILIDDYSANLIEWENHGGIGIKYYNQYNNPFHPTKGLSISSFKMFAPMLNDRSIDDLIVACEDSYMLNSFVKLINKKIDTDHFDILQEVYNDLIKKLNLEKLAINYKYNIRNFLIEYYSLMNSLQPDYWSKIFKDAIKNNKNLSLVCASFDTDLTKLDIFDDDNNLAIKIIEQKKTKNTNIYDIYLTLDENAFLNDIDYTLDNLIGIINRFLFKGVK